MPEFIKGRELCRGFFLDTAKPVLDKYFPDLRYSAGLLGYGSDVLGYDDEVSRDHMWGPRFYLFLAPADMVRKEEILSVLARNLPYTYRGYSVNFSRPDPNDHGVRRPEFVTSGTVDPLIFTETFDDFLTEQLGTSSPEAMSAADWLTVSEHRLLSLAAGTFFEDRLGLRGRLEAIRYYPETVRRYRIASNWDILASEQAFVRRCADVGDDLGSRIVAARMAERLMRLCFLYKKVYAPYSKWFGTAFAQLDVPSGLKENLRLSVAGTDIRERDNALVAAQLAVAGLHNESGLTAPVDVRDESYYGRDIRVIFADKIADAAAQTLAGTELENVPRMDTFSSHACISNVTDDRANYPILRTVYGKGF